MDITAAPGIIAPPQSELEAEVFATTPLRPSPAPQSAGGWALKSTAGVRRTLPIQFVAMLAWAGDVLAITAAALFVAEFVSVPKLGELLPFALVCYTGGARVTGVYDLDGLLYIKRSWPRAANVWLCTMLSIAALSAGLEVAEVMPLLAVMLWFVCGVTGVAVSRAVSVLIARRLNAIGAFDVPTAIVGTGPQALDFVAHISKHRDLTTSLVGLFDDAPPFESHANSGLPYLGDLTALIAAIRAGAVSKVFVALPWSDEVRMRQVVEALSTTPVEIRLAPDRAGFAFAARPISSMAGLSIISLMERPLTISQRVVKRIEDTVLALVAIVFLSPLMAIVAIAIKMTSPGPVLFRQQREGFNCRTFDVLKFRSMYVDTASGPQVIQARRGDARITPLGRFIRRTSIDELPQLFNVLAGNMSLVGPRPHAASTCAGGRPFGEIRPSYAARHKVKPGLTGWAQVCGWRGETLTEMALVRRLEHDLYYVEHWSIWFDLYILARTAVTVLLQRNAY